MLQSMIREITGTLDSTGISYALMGSYALKLYGIPQIAVDLELMADMRDREGLTAELEKVNFHCCNENETHSRFESENDICGRMECMFIRSRDGREMLARRKYATDAALGAVPVLQPTDYIELKLMSMANRPGGRADDAADILSVLELFKMDQLPSWCGAVDRGRIETFAGRLGHEAVVEKLFQEIFEPLASEEMFVL